MKSRLLSAMCLFAAILGLSVTVNAAVVVLDTTVINYTGGDSGTWAADALIIDEGVNVDYFAIEFTDYVSDGASTLTLISLSPPSNNRSIFFCNNPSSCIVDPQLGATAIISSGFDMDFFERLIEDYPKQAITVTSGEALTPGSGEQASGSILVQAYGESVVPIPPALYLFGSGLLSLIGMARCKAV